MSAEGSNLRPLPKTLKELRNEFKIPENAKNLRFKGKGETIQTIENDEKAFENFKKLAAGEEFELFSYVEQSDKETPAEFGISLDTETFSPETVLGDLPPLQAFLDQHKIPNNSQEVFFELGNPLRKSFKNDLQSFEQFENFVRRSSYKITGYRAENGQEVVFKKPIEVYPEVSLDQTPGVNVAETEEKPQEQTGPFKGWTRVSAKQGGANNFGKHTGIYTKSAENGQETRALFKTDKDKNVLLAEFLASALANRLDPTRNPKVELAVAEDEVYLCSHFYRARTQDLYRYLGYEDRPKAIAEQAAAASALGKDTEYGKFVKSWTSNPLGKGTFAKLMVPSLLYGDRDRHIGNLLIEGGDVTKLRNIDYGAAFGQGAGFDEIVHPHKKLLINLLKRKATNHFLDYPLELRTSQEMAEEILRQTTEGAIGEAISEFQKSLVNAADKFSPEEFKSFGKYLFKDIKFKENPTKKDILESINNRFATTLKARASNLREFACEIALGRAVERAPTINGKKDFSKLSEDQAFMSVVKTNITYFSKLAKGELKLEDDVKDRTKIIKKLNSKQKEAFREAVGSVVNQLRESYKKPAELSETATTTPNFSAINSFFAPPSAAKTEAQSVEASTSNQVVETTTTSESQPATTWKPAVKPEPISLEKKQEVLESLSTFLADAVTDLNAKINSTVKPDTIVELSEARPESLKSLEEKINILEGNLEAKIKELNDIPAAEQNNNELKEEIIKLQQTISKLKKRHKNTSEGTEVLNAKINSEEYKKIISTEYISQMESLRDQIEARISQLQKLKPEEINISESKLKTLELISLTDEPIRSFDGAIKQAFDPLFSLNDSLKKADGKYKIEEPETRNRIAKKLEDSFKEKDLSSWIEDIEALNAKLESLHKKPLLSKEQIQNLKAKCDKIAENYKKIEENLDNPAEIESVVTETISLKKSFDLAFKQAREKYMNLATIGAHILQSDKKLLESSSKFAAANPDDQQKMKIEATQKTVMNLENITKILTGLLGKVEVVEKEEVKEEAKKEKTQNKSVKFDIKEPEVEVEPSAEATITQSLSMSSGISEPQNASEPVASQPISEPIIQSAAATSKNESKASSTEELKKFRDYHRIPEDAKFVVFTKPKFLGRFFEARKEIELTEENIGELHNFTRVGDKQDGEKERLGWKVDSYYVDNREKSVKIAQKPQQTYSEEVKPQKAESPSLWQKFKEASPLTKALIVGGTILVVGAIVLGAVLSGGVLAVTAAAAIPAFAAPLTGLIAAGSAAAGVACLGVGAWKTQKEYLARSGTIAQIVNEPEENMQTAQTVISAPAPVRNPEPSVIEPAATTPWVSAKPTKTANNEVEMDNLSPKSKQSQKEIIFTPSKIDEKLGHKELKSVTLDELKSWKEKFDKKIGENPDWEKLVKKEVDPRSIAEEQSKRDNTKVSR